MERLTDPDRWLKEYAKEHGYSAEFEPDWTEIFGQHFDTNPDFRVERGGAAVVEMRGFESWRLSEFMETRRGRRGGAIPPNVTIRPIFAALTEKAAQLEPFAATDEPLVIGMASTGTSDVVLDDHRVRSAMFGDLAVSIPVPTGSDVVGEAPPAHLVAQAGYGAFCATTADNDAPLNSRPHVSGVAVIHRHDLNAEFVSRDLRTLLDERAPETQEERECIAEEWLRSPVARGEVDGPTGYEYSVTYYDLNRYALGYGPPVPDNWFDGPRDRRFGFDSTGTVFSLVQGERQAE